jgi:hypothetical protein
VVTQKNGHCYGTSGEFWNNIKPLLVFLNPKRTLEDLKKIVGAQSTVHDRFRSSQDQDYLNKCGKLVY